MGILHELAATFHLAHDNAMALADPAAIKTKAQLGFFAEAADLVHGLEARIEAIEKALFGEKQANPPVFASEGPAAAPVSELQHQVISALIADAAPSSSEPPAAPAEPTPPAA